MCIKPPEDARRDQTEQFVQLSTLHQRRLYLFILALIGNPSDAEEVLQETSLVLWRKFGQFIPGSDFRAWACQVARFEVLKFRESRRRQSYLPLSDDVVDHLADDALGGSNRLEQRRRALVDCVQKLTAKDRDLIARRAQPGVTIAQIASQVGRPPGGLYKAFERIYLALHRCIDRALAEERR